GIRDFHVTEVQTCALPIYARRPRSIERTWALVIAAALCYVPANVLPIMTVTSLGRSQSDTILSGVGYLLLHGMWPLAVVVFTARSEERRVGKEGGERGTER